MEHNNGKLHIDRDYVIESEHGSCTPSCTDDSSMDLQT